MLVFRSLTIGLLGACLFLLSGLGDELPQQQITIQYAEPSHVPRETVTSNVTVIDVAPNVPPATVASLVRLHSGERIAMIGDRPIDNDLEAGMRLADELRRGGKLVDLTITDDGTLRRVLVVLH